jgi:hypothetical protein
MRYLIWILALPILFVVALVALKFVMRLLVLFVLRKVFRGFLQEVGQKAAAEQPDRIHLTSEPDHEWDDGPAVEALAAPLPSLGFQEAGTYSIDEMDGVFVRFLVQPDQQVVTCIYEHPSAGTWIDFVSKYRDSRSVTYTTMPPTGLDKQPGATTVNAPGTDSEALYQRLLRERPAGDLMEVTPASVVQMFEDAYAKETAWRKNKGISAEEVARNIQQMPVNLDLSHQQQ